MILSKEAKQRYNAFWARSCVDRAVLNLSLHTGDSLIPATGDLRKKWEDADFRLATIEAMLSNTEWFAEGFPSYMINLGPGCLAAMLGGEFHYAPDTVWFGEHAACNELDDICNLSFSDENRMYRVVNDITGKLSTAAAGRYMPAMTDLGGTMDVLASLRGRALLTDLYDDPEGVEKARDAIDVAWSQAYDESYAVISAAGGGAMSAWMPIWCEGRWYPLQSDFSALISRDFYQRFVDPSIRLQAKRLDHSIYHLDGVGEFPHLSSLLAIEELDGIQWVPGSGKPNTAAECWMEMYENIQAAGKNLVITDDLTTEETLYLLKNLSPKGLFISTSVESREAAAEIERKALEYAK